MNLDKLVVTNINESELPQEYWDRIKKIFNSIVFKKENDLDLKDELKDADGLFSKFNWVKADLIESAPQLKYIGVFATGYGKVDLEVATKMGVIVTNVPGYSTESVAEFTFAAILETMRELSKGRKQAEEKNYSEAGFKATEIKDKTFGIIGLGKIGSRVAELANAFGAKVQYWSKNPKDISNIKYSELDHLIASSDILSLHVSLASETENLMNEKRMQLIKSGAIVINTAPMEIINLDALLNRLPKGDITFILDHSDEMTTEAIAKLSTYKNCIIYPPIGYISDEASKAKKDIFVENLEAFTKGEKLNVVN